VGGGGGCDLVEGDDLEVGGGGDATNGFLMGAGFGAGLPTGIPLLVCGGGVNGEPFLPPPPLPPHLNLLQSTRRATSEEHCLADL
jgi:hypothetical protein